MDLLNYRRIHTNPANPQKNDDPDNAAHLSFLISANHVWRKIDRELYKHLPAYLHAHVQTACVRESSLILLADSHTAAARTKMLLPSLLPVVQNLVDGVRNVEIRLNPRNSAPEQRKNLHLPDRAVAQLEQSADTLRHHPRLAAALENLLARHRR
ncbi:MAG: DUF721 domain-containing protein [Neisseria sp.]|nr:DUF721 domain-containing protein [Neisseria sp.]